MPSNATPSILITGASGFIGRHVLAALSVRGVACHALLRRPPASPLPAWVTPLYGAIEHLPEHPAFTHCLHLAWGGLPDYKNPAHLDNELPRQKAFLTHLMQCGLRRLVVVGTCFEYGMQSGKLSETAVLAPTLPYAQAKVALLAWLTQHKPATMELCWARLFYTYGAGQHSKSLFSQVAAAIARKEATFAMSGGQQQRDYLPVEQLAAYLVDLLLAKGDHGAVNVGSGVPVTVQHLVEQWVRASGHAMALDLGRYPYPEYEPMAFWADTTKLGRIIHEGAQHGAE